MGKRKAYLKRYSVADWQKDLAEMNRAPTEHEAALKKANDALRDTFNAQCVLKTYKTEVSNDR